MKTALVISGGSSKGAFSVGVLEILRDEGIEFDIISGTSTGALIAPLVVTDEIDLLKSIYTSVDTDDIVKRRGFLGIPWSLKSLLVTDGLEALIDDTITPARFDQIMNSPKTMLLATLNLPTGEVLYWSNHEPNEEQAEAGVRKIRDREGMCKALLASSNQPLFMPVVEVPEGGDPQVDGGIREHTPLKVVIASGAERIYAVVTNPGFHQRKDGNYENMVTTGIRALGLYGEEILENDIDRARTYTRAVRYLNEVRQRAEDFGLAETQVLALFEETENENPFDEKRALQLTIIRPDNDLPATNLKFDHTMMTQMVEIGHVMARRALLIQQG